MATRVATITLKDVAEAAGVSKTTVGYILSNAPHFSVPDTTRQRVHDAAARLGYRRNALAAALNQGRIHTIGVVLPLRYVAEDASPDSGHVYAKDVLIAIADAARRVDLRITLTPCDEDLEEKGLEDAVRELTDGRVDGLVMVSLRSHDFARAIYQTGFPCVSIGSGYAERPIRLDNEGVGAVIAQHLLFLGHRRIVWCNGPGASRPLDREVAFMAALNAAGVSAERISLGADCPGELAQRLALPASQRPTALAAYNDWYAFLAVQVAQQGGLRVPHDLSVVGFDDNVFALACVPRLTTVRNPLRELASEAITVLQSLWVKTPLLCLPAPLPPQLIVRASTAPPPDAPSLPSLPFLPDPVLE